MRTILAILSLIVGCLCSVCGVWQIAFKSKWWTYLLGGVLGVACIGLVFLGLTILMG